MRDIPFRRHQATKHKKAAIARLKIYDYSQINNLFYRGNYMRGNYYTPAWADKKDIGIAARTRQRCRRWCCANSRDWDGVSRNEYSNWLDTLDELYDLGYSIKILKKVPNGYVDLWYYD